MGDCIVIDYKALAQAHADENARLRKLFHLAASEADAIIAELRQAISDLRRSVALQKDAEQITEDDEFNPRPDGWCHADCFYCSQRASEIAKKDADELEQLAIKCGVFASRDGNTVLTTGPIRLPSQSTTTQATK